MFFLDRAIPIYRFPYLLAPLYLLLNRRGFQILIFGMKHFLILMATILPCLAQMVVDTTPQQSVDFRRYAGRWYEQARYENWFEEGMEHVYTDYTPLKDGSIRVTNHGTDAQGYTEQARGRAFITGKGELGVSFVWPYWWFRAPYKVLYVDPEYQGAVVSGENADYLWLLTRQDIPRRELVNRLVHEAAKRGFDTAKLRHTQHQKRKSTAPETNTPG